MLGEVEAVPISELADINPQLEPHGLSPDDPVSFIPMVDVSNDGHWTNRHVSRFQNVASGYTSFQSNDILFAKITPCTENGKGAHVTELVNGVGFGSTEFHVLRPRRSADARYLYHWSQSERLRTRAAAIMIGSAGQQRVPADFFREFEVPNFPLEEQRRIAEILDAADEAIQQSERVIAKLREVKKGLLHDLLTRGLDADGNLRSLGRSVEVPTGPISEIAYINPPINADELSDHSAVSFIPMADVSNQGYWERRQTRPWSEVRNGYTPFQKDDILFAKITPCTENGKGAHVTGLVNEIGYGSTEFHVLRAKGSNVPRFIYHWSQSHLLRERAAALMIGSAGQQRVPSDFFQDFRIQLFSPAEQRRIAEVVDSHDARIRAEEAAVDKLRQVKRGLMDDLLTGRVRV